MPGSLRAIQRENPQTTRSIARARIWPTRWSERGHTTVPRGCRRDRSMSTRRRRRICSVFRAVGRRDRPPHLHRCRQASHRPACWHRSLRLDAGQHVVGDFPGAVRPGSDPGPRQRLGPSGQHGWGRPRRRARSHSRGARLTAVGLGCCSGGHLLRVLGLPVFHASGAPNPLGAIVSRRIERRCAGRLGSGSLASRVHGTNLDGAAHCIRRNLMAALSNVRPGPLHPGAAVECQDGRIAQPRRAGECRRLLHALRNDGYGQRRNHA